MSSAVCASPSRFIVSVPVAGYLPPPYGTLRTRLGHFGWTGVRPAGLPSAYALERRLRCDGAGRRTTAASAFGTDNSAWMAAAPTPVRRPWRAIGLACCAMLIGAFASLPVLRIMLMDSAVRHPMTWFDGRNGARPAPAWLVDTSRVSRPSAPPADVSVPASLLVRKSPVRHIAHFTATVPAKHMPAKHVEKAKPQPVEYGAHRRHSLRTKPQASHSKIAKPARVRVAASRKSSPAPHPPADHDGSNDDVIRAVRDALARQAVTARTHAAVSRDIPTDTASLLNYQVRLTAR